MKCPLCGCEKFFVKDPGDEYETYAFDLQAGEVEFDSDADASDCPEIGDDTETYCDKCSWHGKFKEISDGSG